MVHPLLALLALAALPACERLDRKGMLLMVEEGRSAEILLSERDGIVSPDGLLWAEGRLYIADEGGSAVRVWSPGEGLRTLAGAEHGLMSPEDLARAPDGTIWASDDDAGGVWRIGPDGRVERLAAAERLPSTEAIVLSPSGRLLVGDGEKGVILSIGADGRAARLPLAIAKPESFAFDPAGNLYIADNRDDILYVLTRDGRLHRPIRGREDFSPETIHHDGKALFITDSVNGKLYRYTPDDGLATMAVLRGELANVQGLATDEEGTIYLSVQTDLKGGRGYILRLRRNET